MKTRVFTLLFTLVIIFGCAKECETIMEDPIDQNPQNELPILMIHGALASGDTYSRPAMLFTSNGYPSDKLFAFDWNSLGGSNASNIVLLDAFIDDILLKTNHKKLILIGHSAGGGLGYSYCNDVVRMEKISKYIHIGSNPQTKSAGPNGEIPTLNIYSKGDKVVAGADIPGATNVAFETLDHYQVATSAESFKEIYTFIREGKAPQTLEIKKLAKLKISGRVVSLGENKPSANVMVDMYYVDPSNAERKGMIIENFKPDANGNFGQIEISSDEYLEFVVKSDDPTFRTLHYYREPIQHDNALVYLRSFPPPGTLAGILLSNLPKTDEQAVIAIFSANQAVIHQRDELEVKGIQLSNEILCTPQNSTIAMFLYDNGDKQTTGNAHAAFSFVPFLKAADMYFSTETKESIILKFNNRTLAVKNYKSDSEGVVIAVFD